MRKKNIVLMRVSTDMQETLSQKTSILKYIEDNKIVIDEWIEEQGISGYRTKIDDREGLMKIKELAIKNEIEMLIVFNSDRIGRRMEALSFINILNEYGVKIISVTEGVLNKGEDTDDLINAIKFWTSNYESKKISERVKAGKRATAMKGEFLGGTPNYGYRLGNKRLVIDELEAKIIKLIFESYIENGSQGTLDMLKDNGIKKRGYDWTRGKLIKTLKNTIYIGKKQLENGEIPYDEDLRIISDEMFYKVQEVMKSRTTRKKGTETKYVNKSDALLEGLLYHVCGDGEIRKLYVDYNYYKLKDGSRRKKLLYRCTYCRGKNYNNKKGYAAKNIHQIIEDNIKEMLSTLSLEQLEYEYNSLKYRDTEDLEEKKNIIKVNIRKKQRALEKANKELENIFLGESNVDINTLNNMIIKFKNELKEDNYSLNEIEDQIKKINMKNKNLFEIFKIYKELDYLYEIASIYEKKNILQVLIDKIIINEEDIEIKLNIG